MEYVTRLSDILNRILVAWLQFKLWPRETASRSSHKLGLYIPIKVE